MPANLPDTIAAASRLIEARELSPLELVNGLLAITHAYAQAMIWSKRRAVVAPESANVFMVPPAVQFSASPAGPTEAFDVTTVCSYTFKCGLRMGRSQAPK